MGRKESNQTNKQNIEAFQISYMKHKCNSKFVEHIRYASYSGPYNSSTSITWCKLFCIYMYKNESF